MSQTAQPRYLIDPYMEWVQKEGVPVSEDYGIDMFSMPTADWPRFGMKGGVAHLKGRGDFASMFLFEMAPGKSGTPQRHLYEEVIYILEGSGSTQLEFGNGEKRSFEWGQHSLFAIPPNTKYRHFNASGRNRALLVSTTNLPLVLNTFINENFVFGSNFDFIERMGKTGYYAGEGELSTVRNAWAWETNFVPDLTTKELHAIPHRGADATAVMFALADGMMHSHLSQMPVGTYKKAHRHPPGAHVMCVQGQGFSLLWFEGQKDYLRIDWKHGMVFPPADRQWHQHFNTSDKPARYLATAVGSLRYPFTDAQRRALGGGDKNKNAKAGVDTGERREDQIEYSDQDPSIHPMWLAELKKNGVEPRDVMKKLFPQYA